MCESKKKIHQYFLTVSLRHTDDEQWVMHIMWHQDLCVCVFYI